jgi:hypothetical protein
MRSSLAERGLARFDYRVMLHHNGLSRHLRKSRRGGRDRRQASGRKGQDRCTLMIITAALLRF